MHEIKCPKCGEVFTVDESGYAAIVGQVRDKNFTGSWPSGKSSWPPKKKKIWPWYALRPPALRSSPRPSCSGRSKN